MSCGALFPEIYGAVAAHSTPSSLLTLCLVSKTCHLEARRQLYAIVECSTLHQLRKWLYSPRCADYAKYLRELALHLPDDLAELDVAILAAVFSGATNLKRLELSRCNQKWNLDFFTILPTVPLPTKRMDDLWQYILHAEFCLSNFRDTYFESAHSADAHRNLALFLEKQPELEHLSLYRKSWSLHGGNPISRLGALKRLELNARVLISLDGADMDSEVESVICHTPISAALSRRQVPRFAGLTMLEVLTYFDEAFVADTLVRFAADLAPQLRVLILRHQRCSVETFSVPELQKTDLSQVNTLVDRSESLVISLCQLPRLELFVLEFQTQSLPRLSCFYETLKFVRRLRKMTRIPRVELAPTALGIKSVIGRFRQDGVAWGGTDWPQQLQQWSGDTDLL
ncbi:hypothetical protein MKEN_01447700 [Mycena kentingensis (nom. inval.)]|nr:hypothetical protein MKEN_01447700 [Mycena kentingensis (nom. inval.)]